MRAAPLLLLAAAAVACKDDCSDAACPAPATVACTGPLTLFAWSRADSSNGCALGSDTPAAGFPVGTTEVHFQRGSAGACTTRVTVTDAVAPTITCPTAARVFRTTRGTPAPTPAVTATDLCAAHPAITTVPATLDGHGEMSVVFTATDGAGNHASCTAAVEVRDVWAATGLRVAHASLDADTTTVTLLWDHPPDADTDAYRLERAASADGPWTAVATVGPDATQVTEALSGSSAFYRVVSAFDGTDGGITAPVRAFALATADYDLGVQPVPDLTLAANAAAGTPATHSTPLRAVVRHPADLASGPFPLVLLLHGNHGNCRTGDYDTSGSDPRRDDACVITNNGLCRGSSRTPNAEGLAYLAETLAAHGMVVASVDANAINCRDGMHGGRADGYIGPRAELLVEHLRRWRSWNGAGAAPFDARFAGHVDLAHVGLFGHSRGAEAVAEVPQTVDAATDVDGFTVASVFSLAPTNFDDPQPGSVPFATLVPVCDGDVYTYNGVQLYDRTLQHAGDTSMAVQLFMARADHDLFNREWRFDDNQAGVASCAADQLDGADAQQSVLEATVAAWFDATLKSQPLEPWLRAAGDVPPGLTLRAGVTQPLDLRRSYSAPHTSLVANFEGDGAMLTSSGAAVASRGSFSTGFPQACTGTGHPACDRIYTLDMMTGPERVPWPHDNAFVTPRRGALAVDWTASDAVITLPLSSDATGSFDASATPFLSLRVASRSSSLNPADRASQDFVVQLTDASGNTAAAMASEVTTIPHLYPSLIARAVLQTVRIPLAGLAARSTPPLDLHHLRRVEVALSVAGLAQGSLLLDDVEFTD